MQRVLIAGGGTGGHLFPGLAVAQALKARDRRVEIVFVGTERGLESKVVPREGFELKRLPVEGLPRRFGLGQARAFLRFAQSVFVLWRYCRTWRPDVVLGTGGYASAPAVVVARLCRIPVLLQEQNAVPGIVNRYLARLADEVHIHFTSARRHFRRRNHLRLTGNPLRPGLLSANRQRAFKRLGLEPGRTTVFVFGGSRGASSINRAIVDAIDQLPPGLRVQFLLQTGKRDLTFVRRHVGRSPFPVVVFPFLKNVDDAYAVADLVVCRAGAMAVSEVAACGLPSILVPYPHAAHNHQEENARDMVDRGAAAMILDKDLTGERLARDVVTLIGDRTALKRMAAAAHGSARYGGAEKLVEAMVQLVEGTP